MQYKIITGEYRQQFEEEVNKMMQEGFEPAGGIAVTSGSFNHNTRQNNALLVQALVKCNVGEMQRRRNAT